MRRLLMVILVQALALAALAPRPAHATLCCPAGGYEPTPTETGTGPSCGQAQSNLTGKLRDDETLDGCGTFQNVCLDGPVQYTDSCFVISGSLYGASGYQYFECKTNC